MNWIEKSRRQGKRGGEIICQSTDCMKLTGSISAFPDTDQSNEKIIGVAVEDHLRDEEDVGSQCRLKHERHIGRIEEFDRIGAALTTEFD